MAFSLPTQVPEMKIYFETNNEKEADKKHLELKQLYKNKYPNFLFEDMIDSIDDINDGKKPSIPIIAPEEINKNLRFHICYIELEFMGLNCLVIYYADTKNNLLWISLAFQEE